MTRFRGLSLLLLAAVFSLVILASSASSPVRADNGGDASDQVGVESLDEESQALLRDARSFREGRLVDRALPLYESAILRNPENAFLIKEAGDVYAQAKNFRRAKDLYSQALFVKPYDKNLRLAWPRALSYYGRHSQAIEGIRHMLEENPDFTEARLELARYLNWGKKWDEAIKEYDKVLAQDPKDRKPLFEKARVLNFSGRWKQAIPIYEQLMQEEPGNVEALKELAPLYSWTKQWAKARQAYEALLSLRPGDPQVMEELGNAYFFDQRYDTAQQIYTQIVEANPEAERRLRTRFNDIGLYLSPTLSYSFLYYAERDRSGPSRRKAESMYHTTEYTQPLTSNFKWAASTTFRHDDAVKATTITYRTGLASQVLKNLWHRFELSWEPRNEEINPRWGLRNTLSYRLRERWDTSVYHQYNTYWDRNNRSNSVGWGLSRAFFEKRDVVLSYRLAYDAANEPSSYFVSIKKQEGRGNLELFTNTFSLEKYWRILRRSTLTTGTTYDVTGQGRNRITVYGNFGIQLVDRVQLVAGSSWSQDNREIQTFSSSCYLSYRF